MSQSATLEDDLRRAAEAVAGAEALVIGAGAGLGVDSGLPDFRGKDGFWNAYPPYAHLNLGFEELANPRWFHDNPRLAWGFYGHRMNLYRATRPHEGYAILRRWVAGAGRDGKAGGFVVTSNVDGQFQRAGFDPQRIAEVHGSIEWLQCAAGCGVAPFPAQTAQVRIDESTMLADEPLPACPSCGRLARPNILMFGDFDWVGNRSDLQNGRLETWLDSLSTGDDAFGALFSGRARRVSRLVIVESGAGKAVPTIRRACETLARRYGGTLIRINPRDADVPSGTSISLPLGALEAIKAIDARRPPHGSVGSLSM